MGKEITLSIDDQKVTVPEGTLIVDAAKMVSVNIPVFCYHPKLKPAGMCRMCLVEIGRPMVDRNTREFIKEADGSPKIQFGAKLETACTTPVSEGMVVHTASETVKDSQREILEFLLTSHPLDCPVCDKGGECPLQNLTMAFGPGTSRFAFDEKKQLGKHIPLGELIYLDQERCIQCGRCVRFQDEIIDDPVIGFFERGRSLKIITYSEPGFDSIFSGNTTDICPVGALTTADFRFGARPWELKPTASICNHCPVGCNITYNVRREARSNGRLVIKRTMPRQNEAVNELWICDKGRLGYHYSESNERILQPQIRKDGKLTPVTWDEALDLAAAKIGEAGAGLISVAGGRLSNEDLHNIHRLTEAQRGKSVLHTYMGGGDIVAQVGVGAGTNFGDMGSGTVIMVVASDLHQEAPIWWLRIKQATERGATLIVANGRTTRLDKYAHYKLRYNYGDEAKTVDDMLKDKNDGSPGGSFASAENAVILFGSDGLGLSGSTTLARACAELLIKSGHTGRPNNGLIGIWQNGNTQGAWDMGFRPDGNLAATLSQAKAAYIIAADPCGDDLAVEHALEESAFIIVQDLFMTRTAEKADLILPAVPPTEREGTYTSGERRLQRFNPAVTPLPGPRADFAITAQIGKRLELDLEGRAPALVLLQIAAQIPGYTDMSYQKLAESRKQWPVVGGSDLYFGGTSYTNQQGLGVQLELVAGGDGLGELPELVSSKNAKDTLIILPVTSLYDRGTTIWPSELLRGRMATPTLRIHPKTAAKYGIKGDTARSAEISFNQFKTTLNIDIDGSVPEGVALLPRSVGIPLVAPEALIIRQLNPVSVD